MKGKKNESFDPKAGEEKPGEKTEARVNGASGDVIYDQKTGEIKDTVEERQSEIAAKEAEKKPEPQPIELEGDAADIAAYFPAFEPKVRTLLGDTQKALVNWLKTIPAPWHKMSGLQQEQAIEKAGSIAETIIVGCVNLVATRASFEPYEITIEQYTVNRLKECIEGKWRMDLADNPHEAMRKQPKWTMLACDLETYYGKGERIKPDRIGELGLPVPMRKDEEPAPPAPVDAKKTEPEYDRAVGMVRAENNPSASFLQRRLQLGYNIANTILEQMEANGVVSPPDAKSGKREVLPFAGAVLAPTDPPPPPASGPGTPTDPDVMDAVGKGLEAAAAVDAKTKPEAAATTL